MTLNDEDWLFRNFKWPLPSVKPKWNPSKTQSENRVQVVKQGKTKVLNSILKENSRHATIPASFVFLLAMKYDSAAHQRVQEHCRCSSSMKLHLHLQESPKLSAPGILCVHFTILSARRNSYLFPPSCQPFCPSFFVEQPKRMRQKKSHSLVFLSQSTQRTRFE